MFHDYQQPRDVTAQQVDDLRMVASQTPSAPFELLVARAVLEGAMIHEADEVGRWILRGFVNVFREQGEAEALARHREETRKVHTEQLRAELAHLEDRRDNERHDAEALRLDAENRQ